VKGGLSEWTAWSERKRSLTTLFDPTNSYDSKPGSLKIVNTGRGRWSLTQNDLIKVEPKEYFSIRSIMNLEETPSVLLKTCWAV